MSCSGRIRWGARCGLAVACARSTSDEATPLRTTKAAIAKALVLMTSPRLRAECYEAGASELSNGCKRGGAGSLGAAQDPRADGVYAPPPPGFFWISTTPAHPEGCAPLNPCVPSPFKVSSRRESHACA